MDQSFQEFCESNRYWLDDYALFMACKKLHHGADWLHWPDEYRCPTLEFKAGLFKSMHEDIEYYRFIQFLFFDEWKRIKKYANDHGIRIIGDIPIFVSMDSADVWANQHLFQLDSKGYPTRVAGVPPDYFQPPDSYGVIHCTTGKLMRRNIFPGGYPVSVHSFTTWIFCV